MRALRRLPPLVALAAALALAACGAGERRGGGPGAPTVTATTTQVADLVRAVGGSRVDVRQILRPNTDPHEYEVRPSDVKSVAGSSVVFRSGGDLDGWLSQAVDSAGADARVVTLIESVRTLKGADEIDPHWWQDPRNAERAVATIRAALVRADPGGRAGYERRARRYEAQLRRLDRTIAACVGSVPPRRRKLVTSHDAMGYYARRYGIRVVGAVIPALTTQGQPSAGETASLTRIIRAQHVRTIFAESSVSPKVEQAIARESGARVGAALWADALGPAGSDGATYVESLVANTRALVIGFGGDLARCALP